MAKHGGSEGGGHKGGGGGGGSMLDISGLSLRDVIDIFKEPMRSSESWGSFFSTLSLFLGAGLFGSFVVGVGSTEVFETIQKELGGAKKKGGGHGGEIGGAKAGGHH